MALTNAQRQTAVQAVFASSDVQALAPVASGTPLSQILPGNTATAVLSALVTALGSAFDTDVNIILANLTTILNAQLTAAQAQVTSLQNQITAL